MSMSFPAKMDKSTTPDSSSGTDSGIDISLLEEINRQAAVVLNSPLIVRKNKLEDPDDPSPTNILTDNSSTLRTTDISFSSKPLYGSFDLNLPQSETTTSSSSSPHQVASSEPPQSPLESESTVFTENHAPNSSHLGILLLTNARRKLQLEEERLEFEKEKQREKEKRKSKKLFFRLSKRVREKTSTGSMVDITTSASDSALRRIDEDGTSSGHSDYFEQHRNASSIDSGLIPSSAEERDETIEEKAKRLEAELKESRRQATTLNAEVQQLRKVQKSLDNEVQDLTETLFQQAYQIADEAEAKRRHAEKLYMEALLKVDLLQAEVKALKDIVKSPAKRAFKFGKKSDSPVYFLSPKPAANSATPSSTPLRPSRSQQSIDSTTPEVDPIYFAEFQEWLSSSKITSDDSDSPFFKRVLLEDIQPCLTFVNDKLADEVLEAVQKNTLEMEPFSGTEGSKKCELSQVEKTCPYRLKTDADKEWVFISLQARNRITAVCDIFIYLRYLRNGIVKATPMDAYQEIVSMRKNMALARFGFEFTHKMNGQGLTVDTDELS